MEPSKAFSFNKDDARKLAKSFGISAGAVASVILLAVFDVIDAELLSAVWTAVGAWVINTFVVFLKGKAE